MQLQPSLATELTEDSSSTDTKFQLNDKFHLINVVFLEDLSGLAMKSEETVSLWTSMLVYWSQIHFWGIG
jgi:hypothetical protein